MANTELTRAWAVLSQLTDPEIPVLKLQDLGVIREVVWVDHTLKVTITPTYSGCPAREVIAASILQALNELGFQVQIIEQLSPAWTTDWMTESGKATLKAYGISPPHCLKSGEQVINMMPYQPQCPQCERWDTVLVSAFGSTACKALYRCRHCLEPFDYFKPI